VQIHPALRLRTYVAGLGCLSALSCFATSAIAQPSMPQVVIEPAKPGESFDPQQWFSPPAILEKQDFPSNDTSSAIIRNEDDKIRGEYIKKRNDLVMKKRVDGINLDHDKE
jgi:hypothetical protein